MNETETIKIKIKNTIFNDVKFNISNKDENNIQNMINFETITFQLIPLAGDINNMNNLLNFAQTKKEKVTFLINGKENKYFITNFVLNESEKLFIVCVKNF